MTMLDAYRDRMRAYREMARRLLEYACDGSNGRDESSPVYQDVVEHRDSGKSQHSYSSCADLPHWFLYRLGVRESWINRAEHYGGWRVGQGISALCWPPCPSHKPRASERYLCGDTLVIYRQANSLDAHALVVLEHDGDVILSADYGQPGGQLSTRRLSGDNLGGRTIHHVLTLGQALTGSLAPPDWTLLETLATGEELDAWAAAIEFPLPTRAA